MDAYRKLCAEAEKDFEGFWARLAKEHAALAQAVHEDAGRIEGAVLPLVLRRRDQRLLQLPRPAPEDAARQDRDHLRGRRRQGDEDHLQGALSRGLQVRERAQGARHQDRATASSSTCRCRSRRWWRCRPARASARRTRWCSAAFRPRALQERIIDAGAIAVITADGQFRGGKEIPLKPVVDEALRPGRLRERCKTVIVYKRTGSHGADDGGARPVVGRRGARARPTPANRPGSTRSTRCSSSTPRARPASRRACSTRPPATCCGRSSP